MISKKDNKLKKDKNNRNKKDDGDIKLNFNLDCFFDNTEELEKFTSSLEPRVIDFKNKYENNLNNLDEIKFETAINEYEAILEEIHKIMVYVFLKFATNSNAFGALYADYQLKSNELFSHLIFFELEFSNLKSELMDFFIDNSQKYKFYLQNLKDKRKYNLSLNEEQILLKVSSVGMDAFSRLFDESFSNMRFEGVLNKKELSEEEILVLLHNQNRKIRKNAQKNFTNSLKNNSLVLTYIFNMVRKDLAIMKELRKYERPESFRHLSNQTTQESVDSMIQCINGNMDIVHNYYLIKSKILSIKLKDYDRYAPLSFSKKSLNFNFKEGLNLTLESFKDFSPTFYDIALKATHENWIDSHPKEFKRGGAFSHGSTPSTHPFVLLNYTGNRRDIFTIAHEFGHMIHQELSKKQGILNMDTPLTTAETASVFAEMLLFDSIKKTLNKEELIDIYAGKIEDIFATSFRQIVMTNFERRIHDIQGELKTEDFNKIWHEENEKMFGSSVKLTKNHSMWWSYIPHMIHSPFYCYAYSYGQLLVLALFGLYKKSIENEKKDEFINKYINFLSLGGSKSPRELILDFGFDVDKKEFWEIGMEEIRKLLNEFTQLLPKNKKKNEK